MLETRDRRLLLEALRPPDGYAFSEAVGTTFTLDLLALLSAPLAFTLFDWEDADGRPQADPLALLEALRRHADHIHLFCQAGYVSVPPADQRLLGWLEGSVVEVKKPEGGPFHPKVWVLRFEAAGRPVRYRVLVGTRNLTFDRSWDTLVAIEGDVREEGESKTQEGPALADFVTALPRMALHQPVSPRTQKAIETMTRELARTKFVPPEPFEGFRFQPLGTSLWRALGVEAKDAPRWKGFRERGERLLAIAPFLSAPALRDMSRPGAGDILVSRADALAEVPSDILRRFESVYAFSSDAEGETVDDDDGAPLAGRLRGLHAKLFVTDSGWDAHLWTGSANATGSLMGGGVEFLVELWGKKSRCGIDAILGADGRGGLHDLLQPFPIPIEDVPGDKIKRELEDRLDAARSAIAEAGLTVCVADNPSTETYSMRVTVPGARIAGLPDRTTIRVRPITRVRGASTLWPDGAAESIPLGTSSFDGLTSFFAFDVVVRIGERVLADEFVLNLPVEGMPADRRERMLRAALGNRRQVLRFLLLLLSDGGIDAHLLLRAASSIEGNAGLAGADIAGDSNVLETLLRALDLDPVKIDRIERFVADLCSSPGGEDLLPPGFLGILDPIVKVRKTLTP
ncbi:MAG: hypothetical protein EXS13_11725 [Planctomycetes bacterium]|nr:hypothetical protein [Planctomycetota bacterium]